MHSIHSDIIIDLSICHTVANQVDYVYVKTSQDYVTHVYHYFVMFPVAPAGRHTRWYVLQQVSYLQVRERDGHFKVNITPSLYIG